MASKTIFIFTSNKVIFKKLDQDFWNLQDMKITDDCTDLFIYIIIPKFTDLFIYIIIPKFTDLFIYIIIPKFTEAFYKIMN